MSELFIVTQDLSVVNVSKIQSIDLLGAVLENNQTGRTIDVIEIAATLEFGDEEATPLGYYFTEENALSAMNKLINWLSEGIENKRVFRMPNIDSEESKKHNELELDYSDSDSDINKKGD